MAVDSAGREPTHASRLRSLDAARGVAILGMFLANIGATVHHRFPDGETYPTFLHAQWEGYTMADLVFPGFLFFVGMSISLSMSTRRDAEIPWARVLRRSALLVLLGLGVNSIHLLGAAEGTLLNPSGTLQRIGIAYALSVPIYYRLEPKGRIVLSLIVLASYAAALAWLPFPGVGPSDLLQRNLNFSAWLDLQIFGEALTAPNAEGIPTYQQSLASQLSSMIVVVLGTLAGDFITRHRGEVRRVVSGLATGGLLLVCVGWAWGLALPFVKVLWTSSFVLFSSGIATLTAAALYLLIEGVRYDGPPIGLLETFGKNALAAYLIHVFATLIVTIVVFVAPAAYTGLQPPLSARAASLVMIAAGLAITYLPIWLMDRRGVYWRL